MLACVLSDIKFEVSFYRATQMHSADYAVAWCLYVCPSVTPVYILCLKDYIYRQSFFHRQVAAPFHTKRTGNIPTETP